MRSLVVANWKMNTSLSDAIVLTEYLKNNLEDCGAEVVLCPPFVWLYPMSEILTKGPKNLHLGGQNVYFEDDGAYTGEISSTMLKSLANFVIIGHSERKKFLNESYKMINKKVKVAVKNGLNVLLCIGENKMTNGLKLNFDQILDQLDEVLKNITKHEIEKIHLVYEPIWAISTSKNSQAATGIYANLVIEKIRQKLARKFGSEIAHHAKILYGGSVNSTNAKEFLYQKEINGVLVGAASLKAKEFLNICKIAESK